MEFCLFGKVQAFSQGHPIELGRRRERGLLALLLLDAGRLVSVENLASLLGEDEFAPVSRRALQVNVSRLRRRLSETSGAAIHLISQGTGYLVDVDPEAVDVHRFTRLVAEAQRIDEPVERARLLRSALALQRGPLCADLTADRLRRHLSARLDETCLSALELRVEADLVAGAHEDLVGELAELTTRHPGRERLIAARMVALYRSGRARDALEVYQATAHEFTTDLGIDPSPELRELHLAILQDAPALVAPQDHGVRPAPPAQLPARLPTFTGRQAELAAVLNLPDASTAMIGVVDGMPGVGKTALAVHAAHQLAADYPDGQLFVDLHGFTEGVEPADPGDVLDRLLRSLGVPGERIQPGTESRAAQFRSKLVGKRVLVVLDNAATESQVRPLLPAAPGCLALITSRRQLQGLEYATPVPLGSLDRDEAIALLTRVVGVDRLATEPPGLLAEVVELCGRLPLAIQIAAARLRGRPAWTLRYLADVLSDERARLAELAAGDRCVAAALHLSYLNLGAPQRQLFRLLALHRGSDISTAAVAALAGRDAREVRPLLATLVDERLLDEPEPGRYWFHDLVRVYAAEQLEEEPEPARNAAVTRMLDWYRRMADAAGTLFNPHRYRPTTAPSTPVFASRAEALAWCETELPNLIAACQHAAVAGHRTMAWQLPMALWDLFYLRKHWSDWILTTELGLAAAEQDGDRLGEAWMCTSLGMGYWEVRRYQDALDVSCRALELWRALEDRWGEGFALHLIAGACKSLGRSAECLDYFKRALALHQETGNRWGSGWTLTSLGGVYLEERQLGNALETAEHALATWQELGDKHGEGISLSSLGDISHELGRHDDAFRYFERALAVNRAIGNRWAEAWGLTGIGKALRERGHLDAARTHWQRALAIFDALGDGQSVEVRGYLSG